MPYDGSLNLKVANKTDFQVPLRILFLMVLLAAILSAEPMLMVIAALVFFGARSIWLAARNDNNPVSALIVFPDGRVKLKYAANDRPAADGLMDSQQWCTQRFAVLRVVTDNTMRDLVIFRAQQSSGDDFRRINMWLRQNFYGDTDARKVFGK
jgi:hypothetical protein